ncbi:hypothetical protein DSCO28_57490 [Desulfosarcina ovata subsp. sediminis]|uniref:HDOD domain-containing protein n=1 Tax=Desulfosarcina ovata subsp. sediminis TaxID=885957 RepID=A0A5K7ZY38_9BACT|nr:HDOD domain-containing protein [Desulfosarcina ovata]BBO85183.1 hypothetical protein DSCO28_57490 [Desulfosarcina ovata subsp. sediminis]
MEDVYVARQPIFNKKKAVVAYELLFRNGAVNQVPVIQGDVATKTLLANTFFTIGINALAEGKKTFINFTQNLLENKIPLLLPKETTVVEILEDVQPGPALINACEELSAAGYTLALDDFVYAPELDPLIALADIIKFDFRLTPATELNADLKRLPIDRLHLLAEKVESIEEFESALQMGFDLFQGYFFCKPEIVQGREIKGFQLNLMMIMAQINSGRFSLKNLENIIVRDMGISYKLLKYVNSVFFARVRKVSSVKQALVYLGENEIRRFVSLVAMSRLAKGKPDELVRMACVRGKFCELLSNDARERTSPSEMFTLGMFSLIDAVTDQPMDKVLGELPLTDSIKLALIHKKGRLARFIELVTAYENGRWSEITQLAEALKSDDAKIPAFYLRACQWADIAKNAV